MPQQLPQCPSCSASLREGIFNLPDLAPCPSCNTPVQISVFPAWFRPVARGSEGERIVAEGEASCFYHPDKRAVQPCSACGRFLCGLCDCELQGKHFCPGCLDTGKQKGKIRNLQNERMRYDKMALVIAVVPMVLFMFFWFVMFITAPLALFMVIKYWRAPLGLIPHTRWRFVVAAIFAVMQLCAFGGMVFFVVQGVRHG